MGSQRVGHDWVTELKLNEEKKGKMQTYKNLKKAIAKW